MLKPQYAFLILFAALLITGCTGSKEAAMEKASHPLVGTWDWSSDSQLGIIKNIYNGILTFAEVDGMLNGTITTGFRFLRMAAGEPAPLQELMFDSEMSKVTFNYDSGTWGIMNVTLTLEGDTLNGTMYEIELSNLSSTKELERVAALIGRSGGLPMRCSRKTME